MARMNGSMTSQVAGLAPGLGRPFGRGADDRPVFLLGIGAQKCGTSFLYEALADHPEVRLGEIKEMHVFDAYFMPRRFTEFHTRRKERLVKMLQADPRGAQARARVSSALRLVRMHYDIEEYVAYFRDRAREHRVTGEITPTYQALTEEHLAAVRDLLSPVFDLRVVYFMRDPVERVYSAMRMADRKAGKTDNPAHVRFAKTFDADFQRMHNDYPGTIRKIDAVFRRDQVFYGFFETLFNEQTFGAIQDFLGVARRMPDFGARVNASPRDTELPEDVAAAARAHYADVYAFCRDRFGADRIDAIWPAR